MNFFEYHIEMTNVVQSAIMADNLNRNIGHRLHHNGFSEYENLGTDHKIFNFQIKDCTVNEDEVVWFSLKKGNYSLHDSRIIHGANANTSTIRRTGYTMRYFNTDLVFNPEHPNNINKKIYHARGINRGNNPLIYL